MGMTGCLYSTGCPRHCLRSWQPRVHRITAAQHKPTRLMHVTHSARASKSLAVTCTCIQGRTYYVQHRYYHSTCCCGYGLSITNIPNMTLLLTPSPGPPNLGLHKRLFPPCCLGAGPLPSDTHIHNRYCDMAPMVTKPPPLRKCNIVSVTHPAAWVPERCPVTWRFCMSAPLAWRRWSHLQEPHQNQIVS